VCLCEKAKDFSSVLFSRIIQVTREFKNDIEWQPAERVKNHRIKQKFGIFGGFREKTS